MECHYERDCNSLAFLQHNLGEMTKIISNAKRKLFFKNSVTTNRGEQVNTYTCREQRIERASISLAHAERFPFFANIFINQIF